MSKSGNLTIVDGGDERALRRLLDRSAARDPTVERRVARIVEDVRRNGDRAVLKYARRFDRASRLAPLASLEVSGEEMRDGAAQVEASIRRAVQLAARNIRHVARRQVPRGWRTSPVEGVTIEQRVLPLDAVGCYVPGGRYPLPSSLLMTAIPARVAGVREVIAVCPRPDATVMLAAIEAGATRLFRLGGAHAIAALAYGTATVPRVDKIVGPGNAYVASAKSLVSSVCAIDFFAGPSEILVLSTAGRPDWIAADLIAQAEHDVDARAIFITTSPTLARKVAQQVERLVSADGPARESLRRHGAIVVAASLDAAVALAERMAPEHAVCDSAAVAARLTRAGTVFAGVYSAQAAGDYVTGSNHVLPTGGAARARGGLSAADFVRINTVQSVTAAGLARVGPHGIALAGAEGLAAHAESMRIRLQARTDGAPNARALGLDTAAKRRPERAARWGMSKGPHRAK